MTIPKEAATLWDRERWNIFQSALKKISPSNEFQRSRFPELSNWQLWSGFEDFLNACPLTTRKELEEDRQSHPPGGTNYTFGQKIYTRFSRTSGTFGEPVSWMDTPDDWQWMLRNWGEILKQA